MEREEEFINRHYELFVEGLRGRNYSYNSDHAKGAHYLRIAPPGTVDMKTIQADIENLAKKTIQTLETQRAAKPRRGGITAFLAQDIQTKPDEWTENNRPKTTRLIEVEQETKLHPTDPAVLVRFFRRTP